MARNRYDVDEMLETPFDFSHFKRSFKYMKKYRGKMILALILSIFAALSGLLGPIITKYALDNTVPAGNIGQLWLLGLLLLSFLFCLLVQSSGRHSRLSRSYLRGCVLGLCLLYQLLKQGF